MFKHRHHAALRLIAPLLRQHNVIAGHYDDSGALRKGHNLLSKNILGRHRSIWLFISPYQEVKVEKPCSLSDVICHLPCSLSCPMLGALRINEII